MRDRLVLTAASPAFEESVLALIGSLNVNWPGHPDVLVYDLGMGRETVDRLEAAGVEVREVPSFCEHWRRHFTWRTWCVRDAPCRSYLWLDAGTCVLRPLDEAFHALESLGYFAVTNHMWLAPTTSGPQQKALDLTDEELAEMVSVNGGILGLRKDDRGEALLDEAYRIALDEEAMRATEPLHRHDQPLWTALLRKNFGSVLLADFVTYAGWESPTQLANQKIWVHRRRMLPDDVAYFVAHVDSPGDAHIPAPLPPPRPDSLLMKARKAIAALRGRTPPTDKAGFFVYDGVKD